MQLCMAPAFGRARDFPFLRGTLLKNVYALIDGFNIYHSLECSPKYHKYKWLNYKKLFEHFLDDNEELKLIFLFTAYSTWNREKKKRHQTYLKVIQNKGIKVVFGKFYLKDRKCKICKKKYSTYEEKQTDINMAVHLLGCAINENCHKVILLTGDSDLIPAVKEFRSLAPEKELQVLIPINRKAKELCQNSNSHIKIREIHLKSSLLDPTEYVGSTSINCPEEWK